MDGIKEAPMAGSESQSASQKQKDTQGEDVGLFGRLKKAIFG
jgi:hypothetical protein